MAGNTDIAIRAVICFLKSQPGQSNAEITRITGVSKRTINEIYARAKSRGFDPTSLPLNLTSSHLEDAPRSGRPSTKTGKVTEQVITEVRQRIPPYSINQYVDYDT